MARRCSICKQKHESKGIANVCASFDCRVAFAEKAAAKSKANRAKAERVAKQEERKVIRQKKEAIKSLGDHIKETQEIVNRCVRYRDKDKPCISCGCDLRAEAVGGGFDAGHFRSRGSAPHLRFDAERNIFAQCKRCNRYLAGNVSNYRIGLIERIGLAQVESLEQDNSYHKWTVEELKQIQAKYKQMLKELQCKT